MRVGKAAAPPGVPAFDRPFGFLPFPEHSWEDDE